MMPVLLALVVAIPILLSIVGLVMQARLRRRVRELELQIADHERTIDASRVSALGTRPGRRMLIAGPALAHALHPMPTRARKRGTNRKTPADLPRFRRWKSGNGVPGALSARLTG